MSLQYVCSLMVLVMVACCGYGLKVDRYNCTLPAGRKPINAEGGVCTITGSGDGRELRCASTSTKPSLLSDGDDTTHYIWSNSAFLSLAIPNNVCVGAIVMTFSNGSSRGSPSLTFEPNETVTISQYGRPGDLVNTTVTFTQQYCGQSVRINMERDGMKSIQLTEVTLIKGGSSPSSGGPALVPTSSAPGTTATAPNTAQVPSSSSGMPSSGPTSPQDGDNITVPVVVAVIAILLVVLLVVLVTVCVCVLVHKKTQWKPAVLYTSSVRFRNSLRRKSAFTDDQEFVMNKQSPQPEIIVLRNCKDEDDNDSCKSGPKNYKENYAAMGPSESIHHDVAAVVNNNQQQQQQQQEQQQQQQQQLQEGDLNRSSSQESIHSRDIPAKMVYGKVTWVHTNTLDHPYDDCGEGESRSQPQHQPHYEEPEKPREVQQTLNDRVIPVSPEASSSPTTVDSTDNENVSLVKPCENDTYEAPPDTLVNDRIVPSEQIAIVTNESSTYDVPPDALINDRVVPTETSVSGLNEASVYDVPPDHNSEVDQTPLPTNQDQGDTYDLPADCLESNTYEAPDSLPPSTMPTAHPSREGKRKKWFSWRKGKKEKTAKSSENTYEVPPDCQEMKKKEKNKKAKRPLKRKERKSPPLPDVPLGAGGSGSHTQPPDEQLPSQSAIYESPDSMVPRVLGVGGDTYAKLKECTPTEEMVGTSNPGQDHTTVQVEDEHTYSAVVKPPKSTTPNLPSSTQAPLSASQPSPPPLPSSPHQEPVYSQVDKDNKKLTTYNSMTDAFDEEFWGGSGNSGEDQATHVDTVEKTEEGKTPVEDSTYAMVDYSKKKHRSKK